MRKLKIKNEYKGQIFTNPKFGSSNVVVDEIKEEDYELCFKNGLSFLFEIIEEEEQTPPSENIKEISPLRRAINQALNYKNNRYDLN
jgi:hypothetical protein